MNDTLRAPRKLKFVPENIFFEMEVVKVRFWKAFFLPNAMKIMRVR